jgi:hypothetical protein
LFLLKTFVEITAVSLNPFSGKFFQSRFHFLPWFPPHFHLAFTFDRKRKLYTKFLCQNLTQWNVWWNVFFTSFTFTFLCDERTVLLRSAIMISLYAINIIMGFKFVSDKNNICAGYNKITYEPRLAFYIRRLIICVLYCVSFFYSKYEWISSFLSS